jgi:hypothetical protein
VSHRVRRRDPPGLLDLETLAACYEFSAGREPDREGLRAVALYIAEWLHQEGRRLQDLPARGSDAGRTISGTALTVYAELLARHVDADA